MTTSNTGQSIPLSVGFPDIDAILRDAQARVKQQWQDVFEARADELYAEGVEAYKSLKLRADCPYQSFAGKLLWGAGFDDAKEGQVRP